MWLVLQPVMILDGDIEQAFVISSSVDSKLLFSLNLITSLENQWKEARLDIGAGGSLNNEDSLTLCHSLVVY